jgi:hypothetical protein
MRHPLRVTGGVTPQAPGRTPHSAGGRASGTTMQSGGGSAERRGQGKQGASWRASGTTSREGGSEELAGGSHARR